MGVVRKQSILSLLATFLGFALGAANQIWYNQYLTQEEYGLTMVFREVFVAFSYIATFGTVLTFHRFYPLYNHYLKRERNDLPFLVLAAFSLGLALVATILIAFKEPISGYFSKNSPLFVEKYYLVLPLTATCLCTILLEAYAYMLKRTFSFNLVKEVGFRLYQTVIVFLYGYNVIDIDTFFLLFAFMYVPAILIMAWIDFSNRGIKIVPKISGLTRRVYKVILGFTTFHFSSTLLGVAPVAVNSLLISSISPMGLSDSAVYLMARFFMAVLDAPLRSITGINIATISEAFHQRDYTRVGRLYQKTSINLLLVGIFFFILIYINIHNVDLFFKDKDYSYLGTLFLILGMGKLFELSMGMNGAIMYLSKHWKVDFYTSSFVILLSIPVNYFLIKQHPLMGAVIGETSMLLLICILRFYWVNRLLHINPYTIKTLGLIIIGLLTLGVSHLLPTLDNLLADVAVKTIVASLVFLSVIWWYRPSDDFHELLERMVKRIKR